MFKTKQCKDELFIDLSSSHENIGRSVFAFEDYLKKYHLEEESISKAMVVLRELLDNAIKHGNKCNSHHRVIVRIAFLGEKLFRIEVKDNGNGFDTNAIDYNLPVNSILRSRRGYILIAQFTDQIDFNEKGNCVTVLLTLVGIDQQNKDLESAFVPTNMAYHPSQCNKPPPNKLE